MDILLFNLLKKNAHKHPVKLSTTECSELCGMSQQNASRRIRKLIELGLISKDSKGIRITELGLIKAKEEYLELKEIFEPGKIKIIGKKIEGSGEGKYYLSLEHYKNEIKNNFGFIPFPGTINLKIEDSDLAKREMILNKDLISISGFKSDKRNFGELFAIEGKLNGQKIVVIFPIRTHHEKNIIEIVADSNLSYLWEKKNELILEV